MSPKLYKKTNGKEVVVYQPAEGKSGEAGFWGKHLVQMIAVYFPEQIDQVLGSDITEDGTKVPGTEVTLREAYPLMCPGPGKAWIYISDMWPDYPEEVMHKAEELFEKHGVVRFGLKYILASTTRRNSII